MSEPRAQEWPELEGCACGAGKPVTLLHDRCVCRRCDRVVRGLSACEAAAAWNALQRVAKGEKEAER